jgi:hypothetical protein
MRNLRQNRRCGGLDGRHRRATGYHARELIGLAFQARFFRTRGHRHSGRVSLQAALLHGVGQLVRQKLRATGRFRTVLARRKHHVIAHGVSQGIHRARRFAGSGIGMHANVTEIVAEPRFEIITSARGKRRAG